jgi:phospholipid/cholesterol/gamma-HCH transport system ATP-binding protein
MARMRAHKSVFTVVILTIENLDVVKKMAGYEAQQASFKRFARRVQAHLRITDICSRLGMNKIMLLLPRTDRTQAEELCHQMAEAFKSEGHLEIQAYPGFCFSVSAGLAEAELDKPIAKLISAAESTKNIFYEFTVC